MKNTNSLVQIVKKGGILNERTKNINMFSFVLAFLLIVFQTFVAAKVLARRYMFNR